MRAPEFWNGTDFASRLAVAALTPAGWLYGGVAAWKAKHATPYRAAARVVCIGNLTAGGTGKTPIAIAVASRLIARGRKPTFLTRGYGGRVRGPLAVTEAHQAGDVGDEPLLLARAAPTVVARDRREGARFAVEQGADAIVMDDGHQNFALVKDLSIVVADGETGFGNGRILPAGPLREFPRAGLARADAVVVVGAGRPALSGFAGPVLRARLAPAAASEFRGRRAVAFAGIGRPEKFFRSLTQSGAEIVEALRFADHHVYSHAELARLRARARAADALLVTTEKDYVRLTKPERDGIAVLPVAAAFEDMAALDRLLDRLERAR